MNVVNTSILISTGPSFPPSLDFKEGGAAGASSALPSSSVFLTLAAIFLTSSFVNLDFLAGSASGCSTMD